MLISFIIVCIIINNHTYYMYYYYHYHYLDSFQTGSGQTGSPQKSRDSP